MLSKIPPTELDRKRQVSYLQIEIKTSVKAFVNKWTSGRYPGQFEAIIRHAENYGSRVVLGVALRGGTKTEERHLRDAGGRHRVLLLMVSFL